MLWDEVVVCIVLGSQQIWEITIQSTVFPTASAEQLLKTPPPPPGRSAIHAVYRELLLGNCGRPCHRDAIYLFNTTRNAIII